MIRIPSVDIGQKQWKYLQKKRPEQNNLSGLMREVGSLSDKTVYAVTLLLEETVDAKAFRFSIGVPGGRSQPDEMMNRSQSAILS